MRKKIPPVEVEVYELHLKGITASSIALTTDVPKERVAGIVLDIEGDIAKAIHRGNKKLLPMSLWRYYEQSA